MFLTPEQAAYVKAFLEPLRADDLILSLSVEVGGEVLCIRETNAQGLHLLYIRKNGVEKLYGGRDHFFSELYLAGLEKTNAQTQARGAQWSPGEQQMLAEKLGGA